MIVIPQLKSNDISDYQLIPEIKKMQKELKETSKDIIIKNSGVREFNGKLFIDVLFETFEIDQNNFSILDSTGEPLYIMLQSIILTYLTISDGSPSLNKLISFRELPNGSNYCHAFQGYAPDRLARYLKQDIESLSKTCFKIGGSTVDIGDLAFEFNVFPRIKITLVYFLGEGSFPASASLLFDSNVSHYMVTAGIASIGYHLIDIIIKNR
jgi:hypothetical protein